MCVEDVAPVNVLSGKGVARRRYNNCFASKSCNTNWRIAFVTYKSACGVYECGDAFDPATNREFGSRLRLPDDYYTHFVPDKKTYIAQAELIAALAA